MKPAKAGEDLKLLDYTKKAELQLKGAEALTFAAALITVAGIALRGVWVLEWGDPLLPAMMLVFVIQAIGFLMLAAAKCLVIAAYFLLPRFFHNRTLPYLGAIFIPFFVAIAPGNEEETERIERAKPFPYCSTIKCLIVGSQEDDPHNLEEPIDLAPTTPRLHFGLAPDQAAPPASDMAQ